MAKQTFTTGQVLLASQLTSLQQTAMNGGAFSSKTSSYTAVAADAGTAISMTSTSATTITINSGLFAAGDTILITNLGSGACVITAGTATVNTAGSLSLTQYETGILHFVSASSAVFNDYVQAASNPLTTTGDMIYSSSGSTQARLGIGSTSQVLTVSGGIPSWATPASGSTFSGTRVRNSGSGVLSIPNASATALTFNTEDYDTDGIHSTSSNTSRFTVPSGKAGYWQVSFFFNFDGNATGFRSIHAYKNGSFNALISNQPGVASSSQGSNNATMTYSLIVGDYIELYAYQNSGGALNINTPDQYGNAEFTYRGA